MSFRYRSTLLTLSSLAICGLYGASPVQAQTIAATYLFNNSLNAEQGGVPALTLLNPVAGSATGFQSTNVTFNGVNNGTRNVLRLDGNPISGQNAGLQLGVGGVLTSNSSYSFEAVFLFSERAGNYRKVLDVSNRASDLGFYVNPSDRLGVFSDVNPSTGPAFTLNNFFHVALTQNAGVVTGYLNGVQSFTGNSTTMVISAANILNFFVDDNATSNGEYSDSTVALLRLYNGALTAQQVSTLAATPLPPQNAVTAAPEPAALALWLGVAVPGAALALRRRSRRA